MLSNLKRIVGWGPDTEPDEQTADDPVITRWRLSYRPFVDANGWQKILSWNTWELERERELPVTRAEFRSRVTPDTRPGHYKLMPVDENSRYRSAEWSVTVGSEEEARLRKELEEKRQSRDNEDDRDDRTSSITPEMLDQMQEAFAQVEWDDEDWK